MLCLPLRSRWWKRRSFMSSMRPKQRDKVRERRFLNLWNFERSTQTCSSRRSESEISCVHHLLSVNYAFLFFVVRLRLMGIFERIAKILQFLKKIHGDYFRSYLNLFKPLQVTNVKIHILTCYAQKIDIFYSSIDCIQKYRFNFPKFKVKNLSLVLF